MLDSLARFLHWLIDPDIDLLIAWLPLLALGLAFYLWGKFVRWRSWDKDAQRFNREFVIAAYLIVITVACVYVPWKARPAPRFPERDLGYGWLWSGPVNPLGPPDLAEVDRQASEDETRARHDADQKVSAENRKATDKEIEIERQNREIDRDIARESSEIYWRRIAHPDYKLVGLTLAGLTALAGAVMVLVGQITKRALNETVGKRV